MNRADGASAAGPSSGDIDVSISGRAAEVQQAKEIVHSLPDMRVELVTALQDEVDSGRYERSSQVIAKKMVNEALRESVRKRQGRPARP